MTIRQYAKSINFPIVGKLSRRINSRIGWDNVHDHATVENIPYWIDEAGNEFMRGESRENWIIITADGGVI